MTFSPIDPEKRATGWGSKPPTGWGVWLFLAACAVVAAALIYFL